MEDKTVILELLAGLNPNNQDWPMERLVSANDLAGALGMMKHEQASLLGRVKHAGQDSFRSKLVHYLSFAVHSKTKYTTRKGRSGMDDLRRLCAMAVEEHTKTHLCAPCGGRGTFKSDALVVICQKCGGTGSNSPRFHRAELFGVSDDEWRKNYLDLYIVTLRILDKWEGRLVAALLTQFAFALPILMAKEDMRKFTEAVVTKAEAA